MNKFLLRIVVLAMLAIGVSAQQSTSFSYQGRLTGNSVPATGTYDFVFELYDQPVGGGLIATLFRNGVPAANGIFAVQLDFGAAPFNGGDRYLEISVKLPSETNYSTLAPRQKLASVPYATRAINSENAQNAASLGGVPANDFLRKNGDGSQLTNLSGAQLSPNSVSVTQLSPDARPNNYNLKLLASRRWDILKSQKSFPSGNGPTAIEFDGTHLWVTNTGDNSVSKILASTGALVQTVAVGRQVQSLAFDGQNIWVTNPGPNSVTKIRASDGVILGFFESGFANATPYAIAFDGESIWFTDILNNFVIRKNVATGGTTAFVPVGQFPDAVAFDGAHIWVANTNSGSVTKIRISNASVVGTYPVTAGGAGARGIAFDGTHMWLSTSSTNVTKIRASDGANLGIFPISGFGFSEGVAFDGRFIWVSDSVGGLVAKIRPSDGAVISIGPVGTSPRGLAFDGANVWVATGGESTVTRLAPAFTEP